MVASLTRISLWAVGGGSVCKSRRKANVFPCGLLEVAIHDYQLQQQPSRDVLKADLSKLLRKSLSHPSLYFLVLFRRQKETRRDAVQRQIC